MERNLLLDEVAAVLRCSRRTVYRMIYDGELPAFRVRGTLRVRESVIEAYRDLQTSRFQEEYPPAAE
jgi:excisionase family DNA binding protein